jgi:ATP synthase protein I
MWLAASKVSYIGIFFGVAIGLGYLFGHWLDGKFHTYPWISLVGLLVGVAAGFRELIRIGKQYQKDQNREEK